MRATVVAALASALALARMWSVEPTSASARAQSAGAAHQAVSPDELPRFRAGQWVDAQGRALDEEAER